MDRTILNVKYLAKTKLEEFFEKVFGQFTDELNKLQETIFKDNNEGSVFALIESAWVGILNNAIIKAYPKQTTTLKEYGVYDNNIRRIGYADFLVHWKNNSENCIHLLFEAKQHEVRNFENRLHFIDEYLSEIHQQAQNYITDTPNLVRQENVYTIAIVFAWIRNQNVMNNALEYMKNGDKLDTDGFHSLYYQGSHGVWIYGNVQRVDEINARE